MKKENVSYDTLSEATEDLKARGYVLDFDVDESGKMTTENHDGSFSTDEVRIDEFHRFEGMSDPSDTSIIYAISTHIGAKGILIDAYGVDGSMRKSEFLQKVMQPED